MAANRRDKRPPTTTLILLYLLNEGQAMIEEIIKASQRDDKNFHAKLASMAARGWLTKQSVPRGQGESGHPKTLYGLSKKGIEAAIDLEKSSSGNSTDLIGECA